jgi:hypothetical protein
MWCLRCYEPVRQLTPRPPQLPTIHFLEPEDPHPTSRWLRGPTTFGPLGRLAITAVVLAIGPWTSLGGLGGLALWYLMGYAPLAVVVLKDVWRRERVLEPDAVHGHGARTRLAARFPRLARPIPPIVALGIVALLVLAGLGIAWANLDAVGRFYLGAGLTVATVGALLVAWNEL